MHPAARADNSAFRPALSQISPPNNRETRSNHVSEPQTLTIDVNGFPTRVWRHGSGPKLGFLAGFGGLPRWMPILDELAKSRTLIVPSLPGFPGGDRGHSVLDSHLDWMIAVRETLEQSELVGADLAGSSVGASFALEVAALWPAMVRRVAAIAPFGLFDDKHPPTDPWAQRADAVPGLMCADPEIWKAMKATPEGANSIEWPIEQTRAAEAAARIFWPLGNTRIEKRLRLVNAPVLLLWGENDRIMPSGYAAAFAKGISGKTVTKIIPGAGHLAELDRPAEVARAILDFTA
jgi:abhydrolase domain-containing protein 6